jgi:broad specificity phosphatase PhoE
MDSDKTPKPSAFITETMSSVFTSSPRIILLSRHGESEYNFIGKIGGDSALSNRGESYAERLSCYINSMNIPNLQIWTSTLKRTVSTASGVKAQSRTRFHELDELYAGICDGLSYEEIQEMYPEEFAKRDLDKLRYKYPKGESYEDVMRRVQGIIAKLEKETGNVLIVSHQAVLRGLLTHLLGKPFVEMPYIQVPLHTLIWLTKDSSEQEWSVSAVRLAVDCVDTFRPKPKNCGLDRTNEEALLTVPTHY